MSAEYNYPNSYLSPQTVPYNFSSLSTQKSRPKQSLFPFISMESMNLVKGYGKINLSEDPASSLSTRRAAHKRRLTIALILTLFLTLLICALVGAFIHASNSKDRTPSVSSNSADSLKAVCAVTQHPESCFDSISSLQSSPPKPDPEQFLNLSLQATIRELNNVSSLPKTLISKVNDPGTVSALKDCVSLFDDALSQLNQSAELLKVGPGEKALTEKKVKDMQTWISASMTDQDTCLEGLDEMGSPLVGEVKARVQNAKEYMSNTLAILSNMPSLLQKFGITLH
nr:putative pectinesterase/pectinesterase inhibitor 26 [Nicotiana tomentosiformis]